MLIIGTIYHISETKDKDDNYVISTVYSRGFNNEDDANHWVTQQKERYGIDTGYWVTAIKRAD